MGRIDAVSARRVAEAVGISPMSFYAHIPDKAVLLDLMLDVAGRIGPVVGELYGLGDPDRAFEFGLECLLDGLAVMIERKGGRS